MIVKIRGQTPYKNLEALNSRAWRYETEGLRGMTAKPAPQTAWKQIAIALPFLWISGFFAGIALSVWFKGL